jgi:hypothetical protein
METASPPSGQPGALPVSSSNATRANITGKVPETAKPHRGRVRKGRAARLSSDQRSHVRQLTARGQISQRAAASHGLQGKK